MFYVYILLSKKDKKFYTGFTSDLRRRLREHQNGQVISTSKRLPVQLVMYEAYCKEEDAKNRERFLKTTKGKIHLRKQLAVFLSEQADVAQW